jgi:uncharacterized membrane protein YphA (DoxX/SURF4 family)
MTTFGVAIVLSVVLATGFFLFGAAKILDIEMMRQARQHLGMAPGLFKTVGVLEVLGAAGVVVGLHKDLPIIGVLAAAGLVGMTIGAGFYHQKAGDAMKEWLPAVAMGSLAVAYAVFRVGSA